jgi:hypothetical protein
MGALNGRRKRHRVAVPVRTELKPLSEH